MSILLSTLLMWSQVPELYAQTNPSPNTQKLKIVIVEGGGAINNVRQRVAREVIVQVNDENDRPIAGGLVSFLMPNSGPGGVFANGTNAVTVTTNAAGQATAQFTPNAVVGNFQVNVSASFQGQVATTSIAQTNAVAAASGAAAAGGVATGVGTGTGISATTIALIAVAAGAAATGIVVSQKGNDGPAPQSTPTVRIGASGTPNIGTPSFVPSKRTTKVIPGTNGIPGTKTIPRAKTIIPRWW